MIRFAVAIALATASSAALAQTAACELHVWPAERFQAMTTGWGGLLSAAVHAEGDKARRSHLASALDPEGQLETLKAMDLPQLFALPEGTTVITHDTPLDRKKVNKIMTRNAPSTASCYSELIVMDFLYQKSAIYGRSLRTLMMLRDFGAANENPRIFKGWGGEKLKIFPAKPGEDVTAANAELIKVFKFDVEEAARNIHTEKAAPAKQN